MARKTPATPTEVPQPRPRRILVAYEVLTGAVTDARALEILSDLTGAVQGTLGASHVRPLAGKVSGTAEDRQTPITAVLITDFAYPQPDDDISLQDFKESFENAKDRLNEYGHALVATASVPPPPVVETRQYDW